MTQCPSLMDGSAHDVRVMEESRVAVTTITLARWPDEEVTLRRSLQRLARAGLRVAVADGGKSDAFRDFIGGLPGFSVMVPGEPGLIGQVKASINLAAGFGTPFILYTEPDKELFFADGLVEFIRGAPCASDIGVVLASRDEPSLCTFPPMQRYTEAVINHLCAEFIGSAGDYCYGPFLMNRDLVSVVAELPAGLGWGWRPFIFRVARERGLRVVHVTGHFPCPPDQRTEDEDERRHRLRQLSQNVAGLAAPLER